MATEAKHTEILRQIRERQFAPVYFLWGEEEYYIDMLTQAFDTQVLDETQKDFDYAVFYGQDVKKKETDLPTIIAGCKRYPVMSPCQLVIVKEAQLIDRWDALEAYLKQPVATTVLVFCYKYKKIDKRKSIFKLIEKTGVLYEAVKMKDAQFASWIAAYLQEKGLKIGRTALALLSESLENNLRLAANELDKLVLNVPAGTEVNEDHIERYIGINKEYNVFVLNRALAYGEYAKVRKIVNYLKKHLNEQPLMLILPQLYKYFSKVMLMHALHGRLGGSDLAARIGVPPYFLSEYADCARRYSYAHTARILSILKTYDLRSKGVDSGSINDAEGILEDVIYRITHG
ncbi:MAG: DNA polymerase III subunit delta [Bacteroidales bacterium]|nr:DNA polymerase III subunit delta [Bacteroidales bacterium]